jgi:hypothetical protein
MREMRIRKIKESEWKQEDIIKHKNVEEGGGE